MQANLSTGPRTLRLTVGDWLRLEKKFGYSIYSGNFPSAETALESAAEVLGEKPDWLNSLTPDDADVLIEAFYEAIIESAPKKKREEWTMKLARQRKLIEVATGGDPLAALAMLSTMLPGSSGPDAVSPLAGAPKSSPCAS